MEYPLQLLTWRINVGRAGERTVFAEQVHGSDIARAEELQHQSVEADGIFVQTPGVVAGIKTADCMPLVLIGKGGALVLHVSRKTLIAGLLERAADFIHPKELLHAYVGPHICEKHFAFEWEGEEIVQFQEEFPTAVYREQDVVHLSLRKAVQQYFDLWNIKLNIHEDRRCTYEHADLPSYTRWRDNGEKGKLPQAVTTIQKQQ